MSALLDRLTPDGNRRIDALVEAANDGNRFHFATSWEDTADCAEIHRMQIDRQRLVRAEVGRRVLHLTYSGQAAND